VQDYPGICGSCIHARSCRTGCVANNFGYGGKLVSPPWLCDKAARKGVFLKEPDADVSHADLRIPLFFK
jgi:hypothetical protein